MFLWFERIWIDYIQEKTWLASRKDTNGLSIMNMVVFLHSVHTRGEEEEGNTHKKYRLMRFHLGSRGRSCWSSPFQIHSLERGLSWWIMEHISI
jgi:hypothetical protein